MRQKIGFPFFLYFSLIAFAVFISIIPDIYHVAITPKGAVFPLIHNHPEDYFSYLSYMYTGFEGKWLITARVTPEHFAPQFVYTFYSLLGQLCRISHISLPVMYFAARLIFAVLTMIAIVAVACKLFKETKYRFLACFFVFFGTGFWTLSQANGAYTVNQFLTFWTHFDPIVRTTFLPHHLVSISCVMFSLLLLDRAYRQKSLKFAVFSGLLGFVAGLSYHGTLTNILGGVGLVLLAAAPLALYFLLLKKRFPSFLGAKQIVIFALFFSFSFLSLLYLLYLTHTVWPWTWNRDLGQSLFFYVSFTDYLAVLGIVLPLTLLGLPKIFKSRKLLAFLLLGWAAFPFIGLFFLVYIIPRFNNMTYLEGTSYIPLGILAVYGVQVLEKWFGRKVKVLPIVFILTFIYFIPPTVSSIYKEMQAVNPRYYNQYIPEEILGGIKWLENNSPNGSTVLSGGFLGAIIPAYSHNYVVFGDRVTTFEADKKSADLNTFFKQDDLKTAEAILQKYGVSYVFFSLDTDSPKEAFVNQLALQKMFQNSKLTIYRVIKLIGK